MPDSALWTAMISTGGALGAGLGGVALTYRGTIRREERQADREREAQRVRERRQAYAEILGAAARLRVRVRSTSQRQWRDMNIKLAELQELAAGFDRVAWGVALLSPEPVAQTAHALTEAADGLVGHVMSKAELGRPNGPDEQFVEGLIRNPVDFSAFEDRLGELKEAMVADVRAGCPPIGAQPSDGTSSGPWWSRRKASSR